MKNLLSFGAVVLSIFLSSCGEYRMYHITPKFSHNIDIPATPSAQKTIFLRIKDSSGEASDLMLMTQSKLHDKGYQFITDPNKATFNVTVTVLKIGRGTGEDRINFWKEIDPRVAGDMARAHHKRRVKTTKEVIDSRHDRRHDFFRERSRKENPKNKTTTVTRSHVDETSITSFADKVMMVSVNIISKVGKPVEKTLIVTGGNVRGGLFSSPSPEFMELAYHQLKVDMANAISSLF